jgi:hypothetical protein
MLQRRSLLRGLGAALVPMARPAAAGGLPAPRGEVILTASGRITATNAGDRALLDRDLLLSGGRDELRTTTPFTDGPSLFAGIFASRLLDLLGATGTEVRALALNDYRATLPVAELRALPVLLALERDGRPLEVRDRGPLWVIYPWSDHPDLDDRIHRQRSIWQLTAIEVA